MQKLFLHRNNPVRGQETVQGLFSRFWIENRNKECLDLHGIQVLRLSWLFISWPGRASGGSRCARPSLRLAATTAPAPCCSRALRTSGKTKTVEAADEAGVDAVDVVAARRPQVPAAADPGTAAEHG